MRGEEATMTDYKPEVMFHDTDNFNFLDPDYEAVFAAREEQIRRLRDDQAWNLLKRFYADGSTDAAIHFIESWLMTYDPRAASRGKPTSMPLMLFPCQRNYVAWLNERFSTGTSGCVPKSRDMGASVVTLGYMTYKWLFHPGFKGAVGSRKEMLVDSIGNPDTLLEKIRAYLRYVPQELLPKGYSETKHCRFMKILNPVNGAVITGEAGDQIGRGGRSTFYLVDEAAFLERPEKIEASLSANTNCRIDLSTPNGLDGPFADKVMNNRVDVFYLRWQDDPRKDDEWYEHMKRTLDPTVLAQEVDLDFLGSGSETVCSMEHVQSSWELYEFLAESQRMPGAEYGVAGADIGGSVAETTFIPRWGALVGKCEAWVEDDTTSVAHRLAHLSEKTGCARVNFDEIGVGKGVASTFRRIPGNFIPINVGKPAPAGVDATGKKNRDRYTNLKAWCWWELRNRLKKTHELLIWLKNPGDERGYEWPMDECLLLNPEDRELGKQICQPEFKLLESGKIQIESKDSLKRRGIPSPDQAEALILSLAPEPFKPQVRAVSYL